VLGFGLDTPPVAQLVTGISTLGAASDIPTDLAGRGLGFSTLTGGFTRRDVYFDSTGHDVHLVTSPYGAVEIEPDGTLIGGDRDPFLVLDPEGSLRVTFAEPLSAYRIAGNRKSNLVAAISLERRSQQFVLEYWPIPNAAFHNRGTP
jgi:hypothetical protein